MGVKLRRLLEKKEVSLDYFENKIIAVDAFNILYQFLTTIRAPDGSLFTNKKGETIGLFSRTSNFLLKGMKPVFVFDGKPPELKKTESAKRKEIKKKARKQYQEAAEKENIEEMKKFAARTSKLGQKEIESAKELLTLFGLPIIEAQCEGEAQAAQIVKKGDAFAVISQDYDSLLFGAPKLVHNLTVAGKRKKIHGLGMITVKPEVIDLAENLNNLGIDNNQLIALAMLTGTDYNPGGIKGIGPKKALKLVKKYPADLETLFTEAGWEEHFDQSWEEVYYLFKKMPVSENYQIKFEELKLKKLKDFLLKKQNFSEERIRKTIEKLEKIGKKRAQKGLNDFL